MRPAVSTLSREIYRPSRQRPATLLRGGVTCRTALARFLLVTAQVRAPPPTQAPIRAGTAGSPPDLTPGPAPEYLPLRSLAAAASARAAYGSRGSAALS